MIFADGIDLGDLLIYKMLLPSLGMLVIFGILHAVGTVVRPRLARAWQSSSSRWWLLSLSGGTLCFVVGILGNGLAVLISLPLLRVPEGSGIKPMALPLMFVIIAGCTAALGGKILMNEERPKGLMVLRIAGNVLCLTPLFAGCIAMHWIAAARDLAFG